MKTWRNSKINKNSNNDIFSNSFINKWTIVDNNSKYRSKLDVLGDSSFFYEFNASFFSGFSKGYWVIDSPYIVLTSYKIDTCMYLNRFGHECQPVTNEYKSNSEIFNIKTKKDCNPLSKFQIFMEFKNDSFYLERDTLFFKYEDTVYCSIKHIYI